MTQHKNGKSPRWLSLLILILVLIFGGTGIYQQQTEDQTESSGEVREETQQAEGKKPASVSEETETQETSDQEDVNEEEISYTFRNEKLLQQHYEKHGIEMGFASPEEYEEAASAVVNNKEALHKTEQEDGDDVYYVEETNEFVIVSTDGYIRTYFYPSGGISYYNRQ